MLLLDAWTRLDHGLTALEPLWRAQPFRLATSAASAAPSSSSSSSSSTTATAWRHHPYPLLHEAALGLDDEDFRRLSTFGDDGDGGDGEGEDGSALLYGWMRDALAEEDDVARSLWGDMEDVLAQFPLRSSGSSPSRPTYSGRTQPREASGVPGRKWEQVEAFVRLVPSPGQTETNPIIVDWCSGKGHLARWLHASGCGCAVHCLEIDEDLCNAGRRLTEKQQRGRRQRSRRHRMSPPDACQDAIPDAVTFYEHDVLTDALPAHLRGTARTHTALHACGELHRTALRTAVSERAETIVVVPCCYEKHFGVSGAQVRPLSAAANRDTSLSLSRDDLFLAVADGVVTASAKEAGVREREQAWRLAFDLWRLDQEVDRPASLSSSPPGCLTVPSAPYRLLAEDDFASFLRHCVTAEGRSSAERRRLGPALDEALSLSSSSSVAVGVGALEAYADRGEELRRQVERLELIRRAFQRPLEMWLTLDYAIFLEENGYQVEVRQLCDRAVTPRNVALLAQR